MCNILYYRISTCHVVYLPGILSHALGLAEMAENVDRVSQLLEEFAREPISKKDYFHACAYIFRL